MAVAQDKKASQLTVPVAVADTDFAAGVRPASGGDPNLDIQLPVGLIRAPIIDGLAAGDVPVAASGVVTAADAFGPSSQSRTVTSELADIGYNVRRMGAAGDGSTDDTAAIDAAWNYVSAQAYAASGQRRMLNRFRLYFPPGNYFYSGTGLLMAGTGHVGLHGVDGATSITISSDVYLLSISGSLLSADIMGIDFVGGRGAFRVTRKTAIGGNAAGMKRFRQCRFVDYTVCAISSNNDDDPFYSISDCRFTGTAGTKAICLPPGSGHEVRHNWFNRGKYFIHVRDGQGSWIEKNYFGGLEQADCWPIWIDRDGKTNGGNGLKIGENYYGTENDSPTNSAILVANSDTTGNASHSTAPTYEAYPHSTTLDTTGIVRGVHVKDNVFGTPSGRTAGYVLSYVERLAAWIYKDNHHWGTTPYLFEFRTGASQLTAFAAGNTYVNTNIIHYDGDHNIGVDASTARAVCNVPGFGTVFDPAGILHEQDGVIAPGSNGGSSVIDLTPTAALAGISSTASVAAASANGFGVAEARVITVNSADGRCKSDLVMTNAVAGRLTWVEFEAKQGASNPITKVGVRIGTSFSSYYIGRQRNLHSTRRMYRFSFILPNTSAAQLIFFGPSAVYGASTNVMEISRIRVYQADCPLDWSMPQAIPFYNVTPQTAAPTGPVANSVWVADRATWDPLSRGSGEAYLVRWNGSSWVSPA